MAVIGKIQKNSILLLIVIGVAMLAFIFTDFMRGSGEDYEELPTGTIYGEPIDELEYLELKDIYTSRDQQNAQYQGKPFDENAQQQSDDKAFNEVVRRSLMNREFERLGLVCTVDELNDMIHGNHIHPWVQQIPIFNGPMGFSRDSVRSFINNLEVEPDDENAREQWLEARKQWSEFEKELKDTRKADKYVTLVRRGLFVNSIEAKDTYYANNSRKRIKFVVQRFSDIPKDAIEVTDEDIKAYYDKHKDEKQYEQEESRDLDFVTFPITATESDAQEVKSQLEGLKEPFANANDNVSFVSANSDGAFTSDTLAFHYGMSDNFVLDLMWGNNQYPISADEAIQNAQIGDVLGPFTSFNQQLNTNELILAKVTGIKKEMQAWVRHILIKVDANRSDEAAKKMVDSLVKVIETNDNFVEMVAAVTEDPGSIANNGEYKWFPEGRMVTEFNDASFKGAIGKLQVVKTTYGYHIVEVLGRGERNVPNLAILEKFVVPSEETKIMYEEMVYDFIYNVNNSDRDSAFHKISVDSGLTVQSSRIWMSNTYVMGLQKSDKIMRFAFDRNAKEGTVSDPILDGDKYVVAFLGNIIKEGPPEFEDVKEQMRFPALLDKQAQVYIEKMSGKSSLEEVASVCINSKVMTAEVYFASNTIQGGGGNEPEVIGKIFTNIPEGSMTVPIQGKTGVYVIIIEKDMPAAETTDFSAEKGSMTLARMGSADNMVIRALREKADVQDNRRKKELGA